MFFAAITSARRRVRFATPYFIPSAELKFALRAAAFRGVEVEVFLPSKSDHPFIRRATYANLGNLASSGVKFWEHPEPFVHTKAYVIDSTWALMGSPNVDPRSFSLNYEVMMEMSNTPLIGELEQWFDNARKEATAITMQVIRQRPLSTRLLDHFCNLFSPIL
jgi:cardiolipin synthase